MEVLRSEIVGLRAEVEALRGLLDKGHQMPRHCEHHEEVKPCREAAAAGCFCAKPQRGKALAGVPLSGSKEEELMLPERVTPQPSWEPPLHEVVSTVSSTQQGLASTEQEAIETYMDAQHQEEAPALEETPSWQFEPEAGPSAEVEAAKDIGRSVDDSPGRGTRALQGSASSPRFPRGFAGGSCSSSNVVLDPMDEMWRSVLQRFPQYPHWTLVKEKVAVYRLGSSEGRKVFCRVSRGGLQVRVGGGWMGALPFLAKHGPLCMGTGPNGEDMSSLYGTGNSEHLRLMLEVPVDLERLLVPTKAWAQRIGVCKVADVREQRRQ